MGSVLRRLRRGAVFLLRVRIRPAGVAAAAAAAAVAARHTVVYTPLRLVAEDAVRLVHQLKGLRSACNPSLCVWMQRFCCVLAYSGGRGIVGRERQLDASDDEIKTAFSHLWFEMQF